MAVGASFAAVERSPLLLRNQAHSYRAVERAWFFFGVGFLWEATEISGSNFFPEKGSPYKLCDGCAWSRVGSPGGNTRGSELGANPHPLRVCYYYYNYHGCCCCCTPVFSSLFAELAAGRTHAALFRDRQWHMACRSCISFITPCSVPRPPAKGRLVGSSATPTQILYAAPPMVGTQKRDARGT